MKVSRHELRHKELNLNWYGNETEMRLEVFIGVCEHSRQSKT